MRYYFFIICALLPISCGGEAPLHGPDPGLSDLALMEIGPSLILPGTELLIRGRGFPGAGEGVLSLRLAGRFTPLRGGESSPLDVRLRAAQDDQERARVMIGPALFASLPGVDGRIDARASLVVESAIDLRTHVTEERQVSIEVRRVLAPRLFSVEIEGAMAGSERVHPNDWIRVLGDGFLLGGAEGESVAVLSGCFLPEGVAGECALHGVPVLRVEVPLVPVAGAGRQVAVFPYSPVLHGIRPGRFSGTVTVRNLQPSVGIPVRSDPRPLRVTQVRPEIHAFSPPAASLGQYVEIQGAGFIGGRGDGGAQATLVRLEGSYRPEGEGRVAPVDLEIVVEWVPRHPDGPIGRYVLDENDALGQALAPAGGLRRAAGRFSGTATPILRMGREEVRGSPAPVELRLLHVRQLVIVHFLRSYTDSLRLFGLRAVDNAVRARVLDVARRDFAGVNIDFREEPPGAVIRDFALYSTVEVAGTDPNGLGYLGYDNTPGRDMQNARLYDRIGGVNALTQLDGSPGYGGIFTEQFLGFSARPGHVERLPVSEDESRTFDQIFDPVRPDTGGQPARPEEAGRLPALVDGSACPAPLGDRGRVVACAIFVLGNLIGSTLTHELGHSLGLANPGSPMGSYHNNGTIRGRLMNPGSLRALEERAEVKGHPPAVFCDTEYAYLRMILPGARDAPPSLMRPPCLE